MLEQAFAKLGLNENEREVYLAVLKAGKISYARVSKVTGINRTTVYSITNKLSKLGLITESSGEKISYLATEGAETLERMVEKEEERLREKKKAAQELVRDLANYRTGQNYSVPTIKFVEEMDLSDCLHRRYARWNASGLKYDNAWRGYHDPSFTDAYGEWIDWCWEQGPHHVYFFTNSAQTEKKMKEKHPDREIKVLPGEDNFDSSLWVIGDYIIMVQSREHPHYLVEIHDSVLARNQRQLFQKLWNAI
jgi:sugar-specific transcriptional regulator TrmB